MSSTKTLEHDDDKILSGIAALLLASATGLVDKYGPDRPKEWRSLEAFSLCAQALVCAGVEAGLEPNIAESDTALAEAVCKGFVETCVSHGIPRPDVYRVFYKWITDAGISRPFGRA